MQDQNIKEKEEVFELTTDMIKAIEEGEEDIKAGRVVPHEELMRKAREWLKE